VALKPGKCGGGHDLVKVTVTEVIYQVASDEVEGKTKPPDENRQAHWQIQVRLRV
jgi:hypothetical protein